MRSQDEVKFDLSEQTWENDEFSYFKITEESAARVDCDIPDINAAEGVKNAGGHLVQYIEVMRLFCIETNVLASNMCSYLRLNPEMFRIKLHGLKNSCSCIGATGLSEMAREIELKSASGENVAEELKDFTDRLEALIGNIRELLDRLRKAAAEDRTEDNRPVCQILGIPREAAAALRESILNLENEEVCKRIAEIRKQRYNDDIEVFLDRIEELVNQYDFDEAVETLDRITEAL